MTLVVGDRIQETTTTTGTGTITLLGAVTQFQSFAAGVGNGNSTYYTIADQSGVNWEEGIGTYTTSGSTLTRTVLASSNAGALVNFPAGTKNVFCSYPAKAAVLAAPYAYPTVSPTLNLDFANSATVDPRITFVRNSTATYYDGKTTAMAEQNLLTYSQDFSNAAWYVAANNPITSSTLTAPDGTATGSMWTESGSGTTNYFYYTIANTVQASQVVTVSIFLKYGTRQYVKVTAGSAGSTFNIMVDVQNGVITASGIEGYGLYTTSSISSVANGWYRVSLTGSFNIASSAGMLVQASDVSSFSAGVPSVTPSTKTVLFWGAQLEQRSSATAYTPTTTTAITNYIPVLMTAPAGVPRLDYNPTTGQALGLLIEESRTNLYTYSQDFSNTTAWSGSGGTRTTNAIVAPDGSLTGNRLTEDTANSTHGFIANTTPASGTTISISVYMKANGRSLVGFSGGGFAGQGNACMWDIGNGIMNSNTGGKGSITPVGNGWYRCSLSFTTSNTVVFTWNIDNGSGATYTGNGYSGIYIWGAQLEAGSFATSYIPTTSATVTRTADQASMTGTNFSSWYNQAQGSLYCQFDYPGYTGMPMGFCSLSDVWDGFYIATATAVTAQIEQGAKLSNVYTVAPNTPYKIMLSYAQSNYASAIAGVVSTSTTVGPVTNLNTRLSISSLTSIAFPYTGHIRKINYYATALPSAVLQSLTS